MKRKTISKALSAFLVAVMVVTMIPVIALSATAQAEQQAVDVGFVGVGVALGSDITVNYYAIANEVPTAKFTMNGKETVVTGVATGNENEYKLAFKGVSPQCIGDNISAELYVGEELVDTLAEYSVLANVTSEDVMNDENKQLIYDLLAYGAAAQQYAKYKTDTPVNNGYEALATPYTPIVNSDRKVGGTKVDGAAFSAAGVYHANTNKIYVKISVENSVDVSELTVKINGSEADLKETETDGVYIVYTDDIMVTDFERVFNFELTDGTNTQTLSYSINAYAKVKSENGKTDEMKALAKALYAYGASAEALISDPGMDDADYKHVVIIGVDGAGAYFQQASTPNLDAIFAGGAKTYTCQAATPSMSAQGWANLLHGVTPAYHGCTNNNTESTPYPSDSKYPSIFRMIREQNEKAVLASFVNWDNINVGIIEDGIGVTKVSTNYKPGGDAELTTRICDYVATNNPTLLFVQFDEVDYAGEQLGGFGKESHLAQITTTDGYIKRIYDAYAAKGILEDTLFIVTADHGGIAVQNNTENDKSWYGTHGGSTAAEMNVMFAAAGKTVQKNSTIGSMDLCDTAAIALYALGYEAPTNWDARVPAGLLEGVTPPEHVEINNEVKYYLGFEDNLNNEGPVETTVTAKNGTIEYVDGYVGKAASLGNAYVSIADFAPGTDSFTVAFWLKTSGSSGDPCLVSNSNWDDGYSRGFTIAYKDDYKDVRFNVADGSSRNYTTNAYLPSGFDEDWTHIIATVDRENAKLYLRFNFINVYTADISSVPANASLTSGLPLNIGQDGDGDYGDKLTDMIVDEFIIYDGVLTKAEIETLAASYEREDVEIDNEVKYYLGFEGNLNNEGTVDATVTAKNGAIEYVDGYTGKAASLGDAYVSIADFAPGTDSFTVAFWLKIKGNGVDPCIISNGNWDNGSSRGFTLAYKDDFKDVRFNVANGSTRSYKDAVLPSGFDEAWTHIIASVDRENDKLYLRYNFDQIYSTDISSELEGSSLTSDYPLNIGQDGTGNYGYKLTDMIVDEFIVFDGVLTDAEVAALATYTPSKKNKLNIDNDLKYYFAFDGTANTEGTVDTTPTATEDLEYKEGYIGKGADLSTGYISIANDDYDPAEIGSFTIAFWLKAGTISSDPCILSNKSWSSGRNKGMALVITDSDLKFNISDGEDNRHNDGKNDRIDYKAPFSSDYKNEWTHVIVTVDIENDKIAMRYNFGEKSGNYSDYNEYVLNTNFATDYPLNIGEDGTGNYGKVNAVIDELMIFQGVLTDAEIDTLAEFYGK